MENILEKIYKSSLKFLEPLSLEETCSVIVREAQKLVNAEEGKLLLEDNGEFKTIYTSHHGESFVTPRKKGFVYTAFSQKRAFYIHTGDHPKIHPAASRVGIKSALFIPLYNRSETIGVMVIQSYKEEYFSDKELDILKLFGNMASVAIKKSQLYQDITRALESRDIFLQMASHELRTPLTSVNGYAQLLKTKFPDLNTTEGRWLEGLTHESFRLTQLVKVLLETSKIRSGQLDYVWEEVSVKKLVKRVTDLFSSSRPGKQLIFEDKTVAPDDVVIGDASKLDQVLRNLLDNAYKFSDHQKPIIVSLSTKSSYVCVSCIDLGRGIAEEDLPNIFNGYYRGNNHEIEGMGIGLFLVKNIVATHKGIINVKSKPLKGTTVEIRLPKLKI